MAVLAHVHVRVADHVRLRVIDGQMAIDPVVVLDFVVDSIVIGTQDHALVAVLGDAFADIRLALPLQLLKVYTPVCR